jgi:hypothetical protein
MVKEFLTPLLLMFILDEKKFPRPPIETLVIPFLPVFRRTPGSILMLLRDFLNLKPTA